MTIYVYKFHDNKLAEDKSVWLSINLKKCLNYMSELCEL